MSYRIENHPVLDFEKKKEVPFLFNGKELLGQEGEPVLVSLRANGIIKLKEGAKTETPFGPFCMQGRCCSCAMTVDGKPNVMTCVTPLTEGMSVSYSGGDLDIEAFKNLPSREKIPRYEDSPKPQEHKSFDIIVIGAGPAGMEAAIIAAESRATNIALLDDKNYLGGQLKLQTHTFFGTKELGASIRGNEIANQMEKEIKKYPSIELFLGSTVVGLYPGNVVAYRDHGMVNFMTGKKIIIATGASEKFLPFEGNCLPGVIGAGGAQTLMNLYGVKPGKQVLIVGGGNIGVILGYQLIQAGVDVKGIVEASSKMGAYEVHVNKLKALGVPIFTRHTIVKAHGTDFVTQATIAELDENWKIKEGTQKKFDIDTLCLAVGLNPLNELLWQAGCEFIFSPELGETPKFDTYRQTTHPDIFVAGDCAIIGEASIARLEGRISGLKATHDLGFIHPLYEEQMEKAITLLDNIQMGTFGRKLGIGKGKITGREVESDFQVPLFKQKIAASDFIGPKDKKILISCHQDIPCNPCEASCHLNAIKIGDHLNTPPSVDFSICKGCGVCITACPGRAIKVLQYHFDESLSLITIPYEFYPLPLKGSEIDLLDEKGEFLAKGKVIKSKEPKDKSGCGTVTFSIEKEKAFKAVSINVTNLRDPMENSYTSEEIKMREESQKETALSRYSNPEKIYVCRCEEVTIKEVEDLVKNGFDNIHDIKRMTRIGMGQCKGTSCLSIISNIIQKQTSKNQSDLLESKKRRRSHYRPPFKKVTLGEVSKMSFSEKELASLHHLEVQRTIPMAEVARPDQSPLLNEKEIKSKIVIIGGGITGVMTAWWLSRLGESDITVIEKDFLSSGQTGACLGGIRTGFNTKNKVLRAQKGMEIFSQAKDLIHQDIGWFEGGYVYLSFDKQNDEMFKNSKKTWDVANVEHHFEYNKNQFSNFVPGIDHEKVSSLVNFPHCGGANPFKATYLFAEDAKKRGVQFLTNEEVVSINVNPVKNRVESLIIKNKISGLTHKISCHHIVNAAGTSSLKIANMVGIDLSDQIWIERHGALVTEKMPLWLNPLVVSYHPELSGYWQQKRMEENVSEGEIVACFTPDPIIKGFNKFEYLTFLSRMARSMLLCQPGLESVGIVRHFSEHYVGRASGIPIIGEAPIKGFWFNIAKKGHGFMCAPGDAFALAKSIISGHRHEWISECTIENNHDIKETMK